MTPADLDQRVKEERDRLEGEVTYFRDTSMPRFIVDVALTCTHILALAIVETQRERKS